MGGFTTITLKDTSISNIRKQNKSLGECGVSKKYHFYSEDDVRYEYESFRNGIGNFPDHLFPKHLINTYADFKKYWSTEALGEVFVPRYGTLTLDVYFGRTSARAMHNIAKYLLLNISKIKSTNGSFSTFVEKCGYSKKTQKILLKLD